MNPSSGSYEFERLVALSELDLDYEEVGEKLSNLAELAAKIGGTGLSAINFVDNYTQWSVSTHGIKLSHINRKDSVCDNTIQQGSDYLEVTDLSADERFRGRCFVKSDLSLRYYFGIPLTTCKGYNIGSLCVLDRKPNVLDEKTKDLLGLIAEEIMRQLENLQDYRILHQRTLEVEKSKRKLHHDIRGPLGGILGVAKMIGTDFEEGNYSEIEKMVGMINKSISSIIEMADDALGSGMKAANQKEGLFHAVGFKDKISSLFSPQAKAKDIDLVISIDDFPKDITFPKTGIMHIVGNLVCNAIKFSQTGSTVMVHLGLESYSMSYSPITITVKDGGIGMSAKQVRQILSGKPEPREGTNGESSHGHGLYLVQYLIQKLEGSLSINSHPGKGTTFIVRLPRTLAY